MRYKNETIETGKKDDAGRVRSATYCHIFRAESLD